MHHRGQPISARGTCGSPRDREHSAPKPLHGGRLRRHDSGAKSRHGPLACGQPVEAPPGVGG
eukprot:8296769-Alexandrium_andersonii.AAC.1